jgi:glyoxylase-like metal-dependent hydrolase (beta-lactamase superfamily II)
MTITRRQAIGGGAAAVLAAGSAQAAAPIADKQAAGFYRFKLADIEVTILNDGVRTFPYPEGFVRNVTREEALTAADAAFMPPGAITIPFNPTLINTGAKLVLIDTGFGPVPNVPVGQLIANLAAAGVQPKEIDTVVISHLHTDHINGLRTADGGLAFPNAELKMPAKDWAFWMNDDNMAKAASPMMQAYFANTRKILGGLGDHVTLYEWDKEVAPGITAIGTPGHTPGHTSFAVASGSKQFLVQSDVTNIPAFFLQHPDWHVVYDTDPDEAQATRHRFYDMAATEKMLVTGYHFSFPSAGHVEKDGAGYRLVPIAWSSVL